MRIDVSIDGKRVFTEAFDGRYGWQLPGGGDHGKLASPTAAAALRHSGQLPTNILGLHEMASRGHRVALARRREVEGIRYYVVVLSLDDGLETRYYIDPVTFLIRRSRVRKALHPDIGPTPTTVETAWSDFREIAGVKFPFRETETDLATGKLLQTSTLLEFKANLAVGGSLFQTP